MNSRSLRSTDPPSGGPSIDFKGKTTVTPAIGPPTPPTSSDKTHILHPPPDASAKGRTQDPATTGRKRGNNVYGRRGVKKCQLCRRLRRKCIYNNLDETCSSCKTRGFSCGSKVSGPKRRELEHGHIIREKPDQRDILPSQNEPYLDKLHPSETPEMKKRKLKKELKDDENFLQPDDNLMSDDINNAAPGTEYENEDETDDRSIFEDNLTGLEYNMPSEMGVRIMEQHPWLPLIEPPNWQFPAVNNTQYDASPFRGGSPFHQAASPTIFNTPQSSAVYYSDGAHYQTQPKFSSNSQLRTGLSLAPIQNCDIGVDPASHSLLKQVSMPSAIREGHLRSTSSSIPLSKDLDLSPRGAFTRNESQGKCISEIDIKFPFNTSMKGLFWSIYRSVEAVYLKLDKLEASGFAIGLDLLPNEIPLSNPMSIDMFSGEREMLWIEYRSSTKLELSYIKDVLECIAQIITPYPICAYDNGEYGFGLVVHGGIYESGNGISDSASAGHNPIPMDGIELSSEISQNPGAIPGSRDDFATGEGIEIEPGEIPTVQNEDNTGNANHTNDRDEGSDNQDSRSKNDQNQKTENRKDDQHNSKGNSGGNGGQKGNNRNEDNDNHRNNGDEIEVSDLDPPKPQQWPKFGNFAATTNLYIQDSLQQELDISFDLRIEPKHEPGLVECAIQVDNCIIQASCMFTEPHVDDIGTLPRTLPPHYITERTSITFSPTGKAKVPKNCSPLPVDFTGKRTDSKQKEFQATLQLSANPRATVSGSINNGKSVEHVPATISIVPISIGPGGRKSFYWDYRVAETAESHLELSSTYPPDHKATYIVSTDSPDPQNFRIKVDVTYRKRGITPRIQSNLPPHLRVLKDVGWQHIVMTLEAIIERDQEDDFQFPGRNKKGCALEMDLKFNGGKIGQGQPTEMQDGFVKSRLNNKITSVKK